MGVRISELPQISDQDISVDDIFPVVDNPAGGNKATKRLTLANLFSVAPVKSVAGKTDGAITLSSADLTDGPSIGMIKTINGLATANVSLGSANLTDSNNIALISNIGNVSIFNQAFNTSKQ
jgi:hypothetical protein